MPDEDESDFDPHDSFSFGSDANECSAAAAPSAVKVTSNAPQKDGRHSQDDVMPTSVMCTDEDRPNDEGPETPASAEKHACVIIRYACSECMVQYGPKCSLD